MTNFNQTVHNVLSYLFVEYTKDSNKSHDVTDIIKNREKDILEIGDVLINAGWVKNYQYLPGPKFFASATLEGIEKIKPGYIDEHAQKIASILMTNGNDWLNIVEILPFGKDYLKSIDIAFWMRDQGLAEVQNQIKEVYVQLTKEGISHYGSNQANWFN